MSKGLTVFAGTGLAAVTSTFVVAFALVALQLTPSSPLFVLGPTGPGSGG